MKSYPNIDPKDAEVTIKKNESGLWALYLKGEMWNEYNNFPEAAEAYQAMRVEE